MAGPAYDPVEVATFRGGMDCRPILLNQSLETFREQVNIFTSNNGFPFRRPPVVGYTGALSGLCQGLIPNKGNQYTICRLGDTPANTGDHAGIQVLYFNNPENCGSTWTLNWLVAFEGKITAYIRHTFPGAAITSRQYIHTWDQLTGQPTYYADAFGPWDWGPSGFPTNAYSSQGTVSGAWTPFTPVVEVQAEKVWCGNDQNDTAFCAIGRARVWNAQSPAAIEKTGQMYYFVVPTTAVAGITTYTVPEAIADFDATPWTANGNDRILAYVLEVLGANGAWTKIPEVQSAPAAGQFCLVGVTVPWSTSTVAQIRANGLTPDALIRLRVIITPEVTIVSGGAFLPQNETYAGDGATTSWPSKETFLGFAGYSVLVNNNLKPITTYYTVSNVNGLAVVNFNVFTQASTLGTLALGSITPGTGYTSLPTLTPSGGSGGAGGAVVVATLKAVSAAVAAGGGGYTVGDVLTLTTDTGTQATFQVLTAPAGVVGTVAVLTGGALTAVAGNPHATTGGTGAGCTLTVQYGIGTVTVTAGNGYQTAPTIAVSGGAGSGGAVTLNVNSPVGVTNIPYSAALDADFGGVTVYFNGTLKHLGTDYTVVNNGGNANILPTTALTIGTALVAAMVVPNGTSIQFTTPALAVGAGVITYEAANQNSSVQSAAALPAGSYFVGVTANGVAGYHQVGTWWSGLLRYQTFVIGTITVDAFGNITASQPFQYGYLSLSAYYVQRHQTNLDYWSGENEAGALNTSSHDETGGTLCALVSTKNRMLVCYPKASQLWQIDPVPTNCSFLDLSKFGSSYMGILFHDQPMILGERAWRSFALTGLSFQALDDQDIGAAVEDLGQFTLQKAAFWPHFGCYIAFVSISNTKGYATDAKLPDDSVFNTDETIYGFMVLSFAKEKEIQAWSFCPVAGITSVQSLYADGSRLYFLSGRQVYFFDALSKTVADATDPDDEPFEHSAIWHLYDFNNKKGSVRVLTAEVTQVGTSSYAITSMPWNAKIESRVAVISDVQMGKLRMPVNQTGRAIALHVSSRVPQPWRLQKVSYNVMPLGR